MKAEIGSFLSFEIRCKMGKLSFKECTPTLLFVQGLKLKTSLQFPCTIFILIMIKEKLFGRWNAFNVKLIFLL